MPFSAHRCPLRDCLSSTLRFGGSHVVFSRNITKTFLYSSPPSPCSAIFNFSFCLLHFSAADILLIDAADAMAEDPDAPAADYWLSQSLRLIPIAVDRAQSASGFQCRWKSIISKLEQLPPCLSNLSAHPFFSKNSLCRELLQSICTTLEKMIGLTGLSPADAGKLQMQSDLDSASSDLDLSLRDCAQLIKSGVLPDAASPPKIHELLARLQIGHAAAKHRAIEALADVVHEDESAALVLRRSNISPIIQLLAPPAAPKTREKAAAVVCVLAESDERHSLVLQGALPLLLRLVESGTQLGREKAAAALEKLSLSADAARGIVEHGGIRALAESCRSGDPASASALKNLSVVPEARQSLADEGVIPLMIRLLEDVGSCRHAAECLQNLTSSNESLRRAVTSEGGFRCLLACLDVPLPLEPAVWAVKNLISSIPVSADSLLLTGLLPRLVHVLREGSVGAKQAAAAAIYGISSSEEAKRLAGECGCIPLLVGLMEAKSGRAREAAAQAAAALMSCPRNCRAAKKEEKSVPNLVRLLDPCSDGATSKYAVSCLLRLSPSKSCRKLMCSYGAIGYLKKLSEMDVAGAKKLIDRLEKGKLMRNFFTRK